VQCAQHSHSQYLPPMIGKTILNRDIHIKTLIYKMTMLCRGRIILVTLSSVFSLNNSLL
jgi:hypothetical protein